MEHKFCRSLYKYNMDIEQVLTCISLVNAYVTNVVNDEKNGARNTQTFRMSTVTFISHNIRYRAAEVNIKPG